MKMTDKMVGYEKQRDELEAKLPTVWSEEDDRRQKGQDAYDKTKENFLK